MTKHERITKHRLTNDEGSSNAPAFAKASASQANDETGVILSRRDSDFAIPSSFVICHFWVRFCLDLQKQETNVAHA
jgi:hypothetical protein